jgi:hypothetical protein
MMNTERELTSDELDAVSGGSAMDAIIDQSFPRFNDGRPPANAAAMRVWNNLLGQYGF